MRSHLSCAFYYRRFSSSWLVYKHGTIAKHDYRRKYSLQNMGGLKGSAFSSAPHEGVRGFSPIHFAWESQDTNGQARSRMRYDKYVPHASLLVSGRTIWPT
jgi:hypothetical protein